MPGRQRTTKPDQSDSNSRQSSGGRLAVDSVQKPSLRMVTQSGRTIECDADPFNSGTEGRLFYTRDQHSVVKIYNRPEEWRRNSLDLIIRKRAAVMGKDAAYWNRFFCWPEDLIKTPSLGLVMPRATENLRPFSHFLSPRFRKRLAQEKGNAVLGSWIGHLGILIKLTRAVNRLHQNGLCHSDLSTNNVLVDPQRGEATLIDCDGLVETGSQILLPTVMGTPDYMAPELVVALAETTRTGKVPLQPSLETDLHSLAVLVYQGLLYRHPLRGSAFYSEDADEDERLMLGRRALFIEHPTNHTNRPKDHFLSSAILGGDLQDLFARSFIDGLHNPAKRPLAAEWERALVRLYDQTVPCTNDACNAKSFVFVEGMEVRCPWCQQVPSGPQYLPVLAFYKHDGKSGNTFGLDFQLVGWPQRTLHNWHLTPNTLPGPGIDPAPLAVLEWNRQADGREVWMLRNTTARQLMDLTDMSQPQPIVPGDTIQLTHGTQLFHEVSEHRRVIRIFMMSRNGG